jgi:hypothetical protein
MKKTIALAAMAMLLFGQALQAQTIVKQPKSGATGTWRALGTVQANLSADHDKIVVAGPYDYFRKLKFKVTGAGLNMARMIVTYDGGAPEKIDLRFDIPEGGESRLIDLHGGKRKLRTVEFWYDTKGIFQGKAKLSLFGLK